ncbi:class I SAM-dependent methyltransferase [Psychromonas sp. KJ10-10]|uniref:class I SAM-dependent methyltransferase n=1 Tax=Psychromonas sp. KJ10-10 TaxID=3391823 RepID=UPI0039B4EC24
MIIKKKWRILTVGDGDLSFSYSLFKYHRPAHLTATVYDSQSTMTNKYRDNALRSLQQKDVNILFNFDVTNPNSWSTLQKNKFDVVIFQFPLLPAFQSFQEYKNKAEKISVNTLNRQLLRHFLDNAFQYFLDPNGQQLCFITSKDVKPYREWNIENALHKQSNFYYLGSSLFDIQNFPEYKVRNVDRDKHVRDTKGRTYAWTLQKNHALKKELEAPIYQEENCCSMCRAGPFTTEFDRNEHNASKKHQQMVQFEALWQALINRF